MSFFAYLVDYFFAQVSKEMWAKLAKIVSDNLSQHSSNSSGNRGWAYKEVSVCELLVFYGVLLLIESTWGNQTKVLREHFQKVKWYMKGNLKMGIDRFVALRGAFYCSSAFIVEITNEIHKNANKYVSNIEIVTIDEALIGYQPTFEVKEHAEKTGDPIPVQHIPRKPHANGLLSMLLSTSVEDHSHTHDKLPYILDIIPHLEAQDHSPQLLIKQFMDRWDRVDLHKPHMVADAAFPTHGLIGEIKKWGAGFTMSCSENTYTFMWSALSAHLPTGTWRAAVNDEGIFGSCHSTVTDKGQQHFQYILSTLPQETPPTTPQNTNPPPTPATPSLQTLTTGIPYYTREFLKNLKVPQLREICRKYNISGGKKKDGYIDVIVARSKSLNTDHTEVDKMVEKIKSCNTKDPAPLHNFYRHHFNLIDLDDHYWNQVEQHHGNHNWRSKFLEIIFRFAVLNSWIHGNKSEPVLWRDWHEDLGIDLINKHA